MVDEVCPYDVNQSCTDPACSTSRSKAQHSYIPLKQIPLVPYSWRTHLTGFAILVGVTVVAAISLSVYFKGKNHVLKSGGKQLGILLKMTGLIILITFFYKIFSNKLL